MTRNRRRTAVAAVAAVLLLVAIAGCGGDNDGDQSRGDPPTATATSTTAVPSTAASSPSEPATATTPAPPSVAPATGIELVQASSSVRAPAGWEPQDALLDYASAATEPGKLNTLQLADSGSISGGADLETLAQAAMQALPEGADVQRLPDVDLDGAPAFHIHYTIPQDPQEYDVITTEHNGRNVGLDFILQKKNAATNPDLIASVLATFRWVA